jgi:hypothetical protein
MPMEEGKIVSRDETPARQIGVGGLVAGLVSGAVFALITLGVHVARGQNGWVALKVAAYPFLGDRVMRSGFALGPVALGLLVHFLVSIVWGLLFALVAYRLSRPLTVLLGALWGVVVWLVMFVVVVPLAAHDLAEGGGSFGNLIFHVMFGTMVGLAFLPFQRPDAESPSGRKAVPITATR